MLEAGLTRLISLQQLYNMNTNSLLPDTADASDNVKAANAIAAGLTSGHSSSKPGYWLHTGKTWDCVFFEYY